MGGLVVCFGIPNDFVNICRLANVVACELFFIGLLSARSGHLRICSVTDVSLSTVRQIGYAHPNDGQISAPANTGIRHQEKEWNTYSAFYLAEPVEQF